MKLMTKEEFKKLAEYRDEVCVSIFIPTNRGGEDVLEEKDRTLFKGQWQQCARELEDKGISEERIEKIGAPIRDLIDDKNFWRHQSDGLAVFASESFFERYTLPVYFETYYHISDRFYVKPLVPMFSGQGRFYVLELQQDNVKLYEATRHSIGPVRIDDLTPDNILDRVGYDYEDKDRKNKTQHELSGQFTQHGYEPTSDHKNEILRFFRAVDEGVTELINGDKAPLLVACQDNMFPIYKEANTYNHLYEASSVPGNPSDYRNAIDLHEKAWETIEPHFEKEMREKIADFKEYNGTQRTSTGIADIIASIHESKIDTLFLENNTDVWGTYDKKNMAVEIHEEPKEESISLMNLAAAKTIEMGGQVYLIEGSVMPDPNSKMNALYRFS